MEYEHGSENNKHSTVHPEATKNDGNPLIEEKMSGFSSSSFSSSSSSDSDPLESNSVENDALENAFTKSEQDDLSSRRPVSVSSPEISAQTPEWSMISASPRAGTGLSSPPEVLHHTPEWNTLNASPKKSPPIQTMGRPTGYDPNRIPSSVFASKPANPMEWSVASNESLFSIHMGNNSFSRDHAILFGKSGELTRPDEWNNSPSSLLPVPEAKANDLSNLPSSLPTVMEAGVDNDRKSSEDSGVKEEASETLKVVSKKTAGDHNNVKLPSSEGVHMSANSSNISDGKGMPPAEGPRNSASPPRLSDESGHSSSSFAFPVLAGEGSMKVVSDKLQSQPQPQSQSQQQPQPQTPGSNPKADESRWFSCFSCRPLCC